jgi:hypothetical protein
MPKQAQNPRKLRTAGRPSGPVLQTISLGLEPDLITELDEAAAAESRSRARQASVFLRDGLRRWRIARQAADEAR